MKKSLLFFGLFSLLMLSTSFNQTSIRIDKNDKASFDIGGRDGKQVDPPTHP